MIKKPSILIGILISTLLLIVSTKYFAEGSLYGSSIEHGWKNNYLINPFGIKADNSWNNSPGADYFRSIIPFKQFWFMSY